MDRRSFLGLAGKLAALLPFAGDKKIPGGQRITPHADILKPAPPPAPPLRVLVPAKGEIVGYLSPRANMVAIKAAHDLAMGDYLRTTIDGRVAKCGKRNKKARIGVALKSCKRGELATCRIWA